MCVCACACVPHKRATPDDVEVTHPRSTHFFSNPCVCGTDTTFYKAIALQRKKYESFTLVVEFLSLSLWAYIQKGVCVCLLESAFASSTTTTTTSSARNPLMLAWVISSQLYARQIKFQSRIALFLLLLILELRFYFLVMFPLGNFFFLFEYVCGFNWK